MNIRIGKPIGSDTSEISSADLLDVSHEECAPNDTPSHIRAIAEGNLEPDDDCDTAAVTSGGRTKVKISIVLITAMAVILLGLLAYIGYRGGSNPADKSSGATVVATLDGRVEVVATETDDIEDVTLEPDDVTVVPEETVAPVVESAPAPIDAPPASKAVLGYDAEKCAAPKTDRAWLECASAAYAELRLEQKRLETRIAKLEASPAKDPWDWPIKILMLFLIPVAVISVILLTTGHPKKSGQAAP